MRLTIAMPCYNEAACVERAVREALAVLDRLASGEAGGGDGEVVVVDDGSTDESPALLAAIAAGDARLRVVRHATNQGIGGFNRRMLAEARGEWVLFTSSDGEFDPAEALRFLALAEERSADAILGYRVAKVYTPYRKVVSWSFNALTQVFFGTRFRDVGSIRMLRRSLFQPLSLYSQSAFLNAERLLVGRRQGAVVLEVPIVHRPRLAGRGGGSRPGRVAAAVRDLVRTRVRFARFGRNYG